MPIYGVRTMRLRFEAIRRRGVIVCAAAIVLCDLLACRSVLAQTSVDASGLFASTVYIIVDAQIVGTVNQRKQFFGSGVIVSPDGYVLTAAHILPDLVDPATYTDVRVAGVVGSKFGYPIELARTEMQSKDLDLAFLKFPNIAPNVSNLRLKPAEVPREIDVPANSAVTVVGFPLNLDINVFRGRITSRNGPGDTWITDAKLQDGSSGSPVFNLFGQLIGIATGGFQSPTNLNPLGLNLIVPITKARNLAPNIGWQISDQANRAECKSTPIELSGDQASFPASALAPIDRSSVATELAGILATSYPWIILNGATIRLSDATTNVYRFCRLELKRGSRLIVGEKQVFILSNYVRAAGGRVIGIEPNSSAESAPDPVAIPGQTGRPGKSGHSSGSVLLGVVLRFDGTLPFELDGEHGGPGGTGGPGAAGAPGAAGSAVQIHFLTVGADQGTGSEARLVAREDPGA